MLIILGDMAKIGLNGKLENRDFGAEQMILVPKYGANYAANFNILWFLCDLYCIFLIVCLYTNDFSILFQ